MGLMSEYILKKMSSKDLENELHRKKRGQVFD